jgi:hypothetical protein
MSKLILIAGMLKILPLSEFWHIKTNDLVVRLVRFQKKSYLNLLKATKQ